VKSATESENGTEAQAATAAAAATESEAATTTATTTATAAQTTEAYDAAVLDLVHRSNARLRAALCTVARHGVAMRRDEPERARGLLEALGVWPLYKGGQFLFDLLEWEDFMLDGDTPPLVATREELDFIHDVGRENVGINFDPANMILYGTGDPIEALGVLGHKLLSVHVKDGDWPPKDKPGALGTERPLGQGAVGMERFVAKLKEIGYKNPLNIEREGVPDHQQKLRDIKMGVGLLQRLLG